MIPASATVDAADAATVIKPAMDAATSIFFLDIVMCLSFR